jgi:hypothetical protein
MKTPDVIDLNQYRYLRSVYSLPVARALLTVSQNQQNQQQHVDIDDHERASS